MLGYFLFEAPSNLLMHRIGARIWIARIMITWGILSAMFMFVETQSHSLRAVFADKRVWWMCLIYFTFVAGQYGLTFWMPTLIKSTGVTGAFKIGLLSAIPFLCAIVAMNLLGHSADHRLKRRWHLIVPAITGARCLYGIAGRAAAGAAVSSNPSGAGFFPAWYADGQCDGGKLQRPTAAGVSERALVLVAGRCKGQNRSVAAFL